MNRVTTNFLLLVLAVSIMACSSEEQATSKIIVTLTDSPGDYDAVNVDIQSIEVHQSQGNQQAGWIELQNVKSGVYDLLQLTNGVEAVLTETDFPSGKISQLRLVLGNKNSLVKDGETIPLTVPSGGQTGLKLLINQDLEAGVTYTFKLDFDAAQSVVKAGASDLFVLKPVIRVITEAISGAIKGHVLPASESVAIYAMQGADTIAASYAIEDESGFLIHGVPAGTYNVVVDAGETSSLQPFTIEGVTVITGEVTVMDTVKLH